MVFLQNQVAKIKSKDWLSDLKSSLHVLKISKPLIITSNGNLKRLNLKRNFSKSLIFNNVKVNPTFQSCNEAITFCSKHQFDGIVAIGGGSVMDTSKVVMAHSNHYRRRNGVGEWYPSQ